MVPAQLASNMASTLCMYGISLYVVVSVCVFLLAISHPPMSSKNTAAKSRVLSLKWSSGQCGKVKQSSMMGCFCPVLMSCPVLVCKKS